MYNFNKYIDENNINNLLNKADKEIITDIKENQNKDNIIRIQRFYFKLIVIKDIYY